MTRHQRSQKFVPSVLMFWYVVTMLIVMLPGYDYWQYRIGIDPVIWMVFLPFVPYWLTMQAIHKLHESVKEEVLEELRYIENMKESQQGQNDQQDR